MYEFGINSFHSIEEFSGNKKAIGSKPLIVFLGDQWQNDSLYAKLQNLFLDLFRGYKADKFVLTGIDHVITCATVDGNIAIRSYYVNYSKSSSGSTIPDLTLKPMGPHFDLTIRRTQVPSDDMWKTACRKPKKYVPFPFLILLLIMDVFCSCFFLAYLRRKSKMLRNQ
jgi:ribosome production factor 2